jgi:hypothetical protein
MIRKERVNGNITSFECFDDNGHLISSGAELRPSLFARVDLTKKSYIGLHRKQQKKS